jgi:RimJ/RimL family protein N-acetyltransferase
MLAVIKIDKMNFNRINVRIEDENLILKPLLVSDSTFINEMFKDSDIKQYYIVPNEAQQDYKKLVDYWLNDVRNGAGTCWIIFQKGRGLFSRDKKVGFRAFEFRDSLKKARISCAVLPEFRRKGISTNSAKLVIEKLKNEGVEIIEADIDRENTSSERVVEKLGFIANKKQALIDPEMMRNGDIRMRTLWKKELVKLSKNQEIGRIPLDATINQIVPEINQIIEEINTKGQLSNLLVRYFYLLGRIKFVENNFEEAIEAFGQCNMITMNEGLPEIHENYYWFAKINEVKGEYGSAKMYFELALEMYDENPNYISKTEIEQEINN